MIRWRQTALLRAGPCGTPSITRRHMPPMCMRSADSACSPRRAVRPSGRSTQRPTTPITPTLRGGARHSRLSAKAAHRSALISRHSPSMRVLSGGVADDCRHARGERQTAAWKSDAPWVWDSCCMASALHGPSSHSIARSCASPPRVIGARTGQTPEANGANDAKRAASEFTLAPGRGRTATKLRGDTTPG